jgi:hypothetical protein
MKKADLKVTLLAVLIALAAACGGEDKKTNPLVLSGRDTSYTTVDVAVNITTNEYARLTAQKVVFDTTLLVVTDSTATNVTREKKTIRDSSYMAWYPVVQVDSAKKALRNKANTADSVKMDWVPAAKSVILHDFNKRWPIK